MVDGGEVVTVVVVSGAEEYYRYIYIYCPQKIGDIGSIKNKTRPLL